MIRVFSTFTGIGGFELGIIGAIGERAEFIGYSEIDKFAVQVYKKQFPNHKNYGDITKIIASEVPNHDLFVGGFPCQSFSVAGKRGGFKDTRGTLFFDIARILKVKKPKNFVLENVKGLLNHDKGNTFATIISTIDELGYDCQWDVLNSKNFGVPQNRERVFIIGHLRGTSRPKVFPIRGSNKKTIKCINKPKYSKDNKYEVGRRVYADKGLSPTCQAQGSDDIKVICVDDKASLKRRNEMVNRSPALKASRSNYALKILKTPDKQSPCLTAAMGMGGGNIPMLKFPTNTKKGYTEAKEGDGINLAFPNSKTRRGRVIKKTSPTLQTGGVGGVLTSPTVTAGCDDRGFFQKQLMKKTGLIRRLTPVECERLQGFPDNWTKIGTEGLVSDTQRYKMCGNAVTVNVIKAIMEKLFI